eukprot:399258-Prorocentrum_minimum.AAC.1
MTPQLREAAHRLRRHTRARLVKLVATQHLHRQALTDPPAPRSAPRSGLLRTNQGRKQRASASASGSKGG